MRKPLAALLAIVLGLSASLVTAAPAAADTACPTPSFVLGFAALKDQLGDIMGDPLECEHANPQNGDSLQQTTTGLAFYRKSTNTPTFTDGYQHWALTPDGLVTWYGDSVDPPNADGSIAPPPPAAAPSAPAPAQPVSPPPPIAPWGPSLSGGSQPVPPATPSTGTSGCYDVGATRCLRADPLLRTTLDVLQQTSRGPQLLRTAANAGVVVQRGTVPPQAWADFQSNGLLVTIGTSTDGFSAQDRAPVMAHELQHAADLVQKGLAAVSSTSGCYATEEDAFATEASVWTDVWKARLPQPQNQLEAELNAITRAIATNPQGFTSQLLTVYRSECAS